VLEIGVGSGANVAHYRRATSFWGIEPDPDRAAQAQQVARQLTQGRGIPAHVQVAPAERLPFGPERFDTVVSSLVFCSVTDQGQALDEIRRVLRPQGHLWMIEHVRPQTSLMADVTDWLTPSWRRIAHNCHLNRPTLEVLRDHGWQVEVRARLGVFVKLRAWVK
jgi:ubiquinone/menaquinone biosynthesis C-methylase UbiE